MGTRDEAALSDAERAALAGLETKAEADDPRLAAQLRGRRRRPSPKVPPVLIRLSHTAAGPLFALGGVVVMILALTIAVPLAAVGVLLLVGGGIMTSVLVKTRIERGRVFIRRSEDADPGRGEGPRSSV